MKAALFLALGIFGGGFLIYWIWAARRGPKAGMPSPLDIGMGLVVNFFDALGIGSFATMSAWFKLRKLIPDEQIPGTMNVGIALPAILEGFIYISIVDVDVTTLTAMIAASVVGAWLGAGVVSRWPRIKIQLGMGCVLLATAAFGLATKFHLLPGGGDLMGLAGTKLLLAVLANAVLGALMTLGIGFFAPCMMVIYLLGMNPKAAFPIMMGSVAFLGPVASAPFIRERRYDLKRALGITLGGIPGVLLAAYLVRSLPLDAIRWLVIAVVSYTGLMMLRSAAAERLRLKQKTGQLTAVSPE